MNESITTTTNHFTGCAILAAIGAKLQQLDVLSPIRKRVQIRQKTIKHTPLDKLMDAFISLLAGAHGLVEINSRLRADPGLQRAFGRTSCAEQSVVQETLSACAEENVLQVHQALDEIYRAQSQGFHHDYQAAFQLLDVDLTGMPCGPKAAFATRGYFAGLYHRRGRQLGRVLATQYEEVVVDQLFAGNVQLIKALQPLVETAETTLQLDDAKRRRTIIRVDAGAGTEDDLHWLLSRGYEVMAKEYSGRRITRLSQTVKEWVQDPTWSERSFGWVSEEAAGYVRPMRRIAVRCRRRDGTFAYGILMCSLSIEQVLPLLGWEASQAADPTAVLLAYVTFYDQRGGGIETSFKGDKQGLGLTKRNKKRFEAQCMLALLGSLAHNVVVWARRWLNSPKIHRYGILRMVRDVFHVSGLLRFNALHQVVEIELNQDAPLAHSLLYPLQELLAPFQIVVILGET
ncbi:transposase [Ktedonobacter racemifer]|uniref:Transposase IS4 family protein n=1 Tax=Ktedonobacter racemifer DSM 44963 TaxID=485913 RepID=D6TBH5_KTERA|nr:transposase [Ktedonobacter racemifer]EFH87959.1 transposase IS4 family protein [Ktedonobacter racemifer DSM 44963]